MCRLNPGKGLSMKKIGRHRTYLFLVMALVAISSPVVGATVVVGSSEGGGTFTFEPGVPYELALSRAERIWEIHYRVSFTVRRGEPVHGEVDIICNVKKVSGPLVIDFAGERVVSVSDGSVDLPYSFRDEHIIIDTEHLKTGRNFFNIAFISHEGPLHREERYLYTLFVPDRARFVFPCFDQPNLKARFTLSLDIPLGWKAVSNTSVSDERIAGGRRIVTFNETPPLSTYFVSFAAGEFSVERGSREGRSMHLYHLERDTTKVNRNVEEIFDLHAEALSWMEAYTGIEYPFGKFDIVVIPSFTYSGMEHPGAILYRSERLFLEESATEKDRLRRASVISHETAHMWFGDLVTMSWFDDVWLKEAFAQFMADRIIRPAFPDVDHQLLFVTSHYDPLYDIERTAGTHPIRQELDNLNEAGSLYGDIIYHKPPVMLNQLEVLMGEDALREGLRTYCTRYRFGNARWEDLITILDQMTEEDLEAWSHVWVMEAGRPVVSLHVDTAGDGTVEEMVLTQEDPQGRGRHWPQTFDLALCDGEREDVARIFMKSPRTVVPEARGKRYSFILSDASGEGLGCFRIDEGSISTLRESFPLCTDPLRRAVLVRTFRDNLLCGNITDPLLYMKYLMWSLEREGIEINVQTILNYIVEAFWSFIPERMREEYAGRIERMLLEKISSSTATSLKAACFRAFQSVVLTEGGVEILKNVWSGSREIAGLKFSERDYSGMALELATRSLPDWRDILDRQEERIENEEVKLRFQFVRPAASADEGERDSFFAGLADVGNRRREPWVLEALSYLHHPLRVEKSVKYILPSLELLEEIRRTGDIFFPRNWLEVTLRFHTADGAVAVVKRFLDSHPHYPEKLRLIILQAADLLFRANRIHNNLDLREG